MSIFNVVERTMPELTDDMTVADLVDVLEHLALPRRPTPPPCASIAACATIWCVCCGGGDREHLSAGRPPPSPVGSALLCRYDL